MPPTNTSRETSSVVFPRERIPLLQRFQGIDCADISIKAKDQMNFPDSSLEIRVTGLKPGQQTPTGSAVCLSCTPLGLADFRLAFFPLKAIGITDNELFLVSLDDSGQVTGLHGSPAVHAPVCRSLVDLSSMEGRDKAERVVNELFSMIKEQGEFSGELPGRPG